MPEGSKACGSDATDDALKVSKDTQRVKMKTGIKRPRNSAFCPLFVLLRRNKLPLFAQDSAPIIFRTATQQRSYTRKKTTHTMAVPRPHTLVIPSNYTSSRPAPGSFSASSAMALSRAEERFLFHLSLFGLVLAPFAALESLFMSMFPVDPATPFRVFPRAGAHPDYPAGLPHLFALLVIVRIPEAVARRNREAQEEGGGPAARPLMRRVWRQILVTATVLLYVACYNAAVDELLREPGRVLIASLKMLVAAMMM